MAGFNGDAGRRAAITGILEDVDSAHEAASRLGFDMTRETSQDGVGASNPDAMANFLGLIDGFYPSAEELGNPF